MATIRITNLRLRTVIGANDWERDIKQDVVLNITITFDAKKSRATDSLEDTIDYKSLSKAIIQQVESSSYYLLERLADAVLEIIMNDNRVQTATVRIDKPGALRFADSVSLELSQVR